MKNKKTLAIALYAVYAVLMVLVIFFGSDVANAITAKLEMRFAHKTVTDVTVDIPPDEKLLAGKYYYPQYTPHGPYRGSPGIRYASLDPEVLTVLDSGAIRASVDFEGDEINARVRITSAYDDDFEKVVSFRFIKKYPEDFSVSYTVKSLGENTGRTHIGVPVYVFPRINAPKDYNVTDFELIYDAEYFTEGDDGSLIPIAATGGEGVRVGVRYANGAVGYTEPFTVEPQTEALEFDEIRLNANPSDGYVGIRGKSLFITLYNGGEPIATDYEISLAKTGDAKRDGMGGMYFLTAGEKAMTVTLPNGYARTATFLIENVLALPKLKDAEASDTHSITLRTTDSLTLSFFFDEQVSYDTVTYEYDGEILDLYSSARNFTLRPRTHGTTELRVIVDDGYTRLEDVYTVNIKRDLRPFSMIYENPGLFVAKVLGHVALFALLAFFAANMFKYFKIEKETLRILAYLATAMPIAVFTELLQMLIPGRVASMSDVLVDMIGFSAGTLMVITLIKCQKKITKLRHKKLTAEADNIGDDREAQANCDGTENE